MNEPKVGSVRSLKNRTNSQHFSTFKNLASSILDAFRYILKKRFIVYVFMALVVIAHITRYEYLEIGSTRYPTIMRVNKWTNNVSIYAPEQVKWLPYDLEGVDNY